MPVESTYVWRQALFGRKLCILGRTQLHSPFARASQSMEEKNKKVFKELGLFSLKKKIEDAVDRAEMIAPAALELEEARRIKQEEVLREYNLWDDLAKSNESLIDLDDAIKVVSALKDLRYKAEEAKLITELADMDVINHQLFKQAYSASLDVCKFLDRYEMSKLLGGLYDREGACVTVRTESAEQSSELWAEKLVNMYIRWAEKQGYRGRVIENCLFTGRGIKSTTIEFESEFIFGYLCGEEGAHRMVHNCLDGSITHESCSAGVEVIPIFLGSAPDLHIEDKHLDISSLSSHGQGWHSKEGQFAVRVHHRPTGITVQCTGERNHFANKMKAINRLKAKLLLIKTRQGVSDVNKINRDAIVDVLKHETRRYSFRPSKLVQDIKTGFQLSDLNSVLDGYIEPFLKAYINLRKERDLD